MPAYSPVIQNLRVAYPYRVSVLRLDKIHPEISGNKWFKLKHNIEAARKLGINQLITFGGAYSNHIAAAAACAKAQGLKIVGIIRGEENPENNPTLRKAAEDGMELHFVSREQYRLKHTGAFLQLLSEKFGGHYLIPEGGSNAEGVKGCAEILEGIADVEYVFCACGTGTTYAGLLASVKKANVIGISVLKGANLLPISVAQQVFEITGRNIPVCGNECHHKPLLTEHAITNRYCFSGYAAYDQELVAFKKRFEEEHKIPLDYVYTAKLMYAVFDMMEKRCFPADSRLLIVHSGGLQGNRGFEERYHL